ncbi:hypothetical protein IKE96_03685 [bacterium]|nr:hypothetical protein [bacterium]
MRIDRRKIKFYRRKINAILSFNIILMLLTIGYAYLSTGISINGVGYINKAEWDVHFDSIETKVGSVTPIEEPNKVSPTSVTFSARLENPGDFYEFNIDLVNNGTISAMIEDFNILPILTQEQMNYFDFNVTYSDGTLLADNQLLSAKSSKTLKVTFHYKELDNVDLYPIEDQVFHFNLDINYVQADETAIEV